MNWIKLSDQLPPVNELVLFWFKGHKDPHKMIPATRINEREYFTHVPSLPRGGATLSSSYFDMFYSHWCHIEGPK